jgi:hypothetical protein
MLIRCLIQFLHLLQFCFKFWGYFKIHQRKCATAQIYAIQLQSSDSDDDAYTHSYSFPSPYKGFIAEVHAYNRKYTHSWIFFFLFYEFIKLRDTQNTRSLALPRLCAIVMFIERLIPFFFFSPEIIKLM